MSLFEVVRLWDAWTSIRNTQVLRDLFRHPATCPQTSEISNLFTIPDHLFVTTCTYEVSDIDAQCPPSVCLYTFYCGPLQCTMVGSHDSQMTLPLPQQYSRVVEILDCSVPNYQQIAVVQESGDFTVFDFNGDNGCWSFKSQDCLRLSLNNSVHSCVLHSASVVVYCEGVKGEGEEGVGEYGWQVSTRNLEHDSHGSITLGPPTALLTHCPPMHLRPFKEGVCLQPDKGPAPPNLLFFWMPGHKRVQPFIWNNPRPMSPLSSSSNDFRTITLRLAGQWSKAPQEPLLIAMATHPVTNQLLALSSDGGVYNILHKSGKLVRQQLIRLLDFAHHCPPAPSLPLGQLQLFSLHTYYGTCLKGEMRLYDSFTGECVWECEDHEGSGTHLWTSPPDQCGVFNGSGVWVVRVRKIADHAHFLTQPFCNGSETTTAGHHDNGNLLAARLCHLWGLHLLATKYSLEAAHLTCKPQSSDSQPLLPQLPHELVTLLSEGSLQNPALSVALLAEYPSHRGHLKKQISTFLECYHHSGPREADSRLLTPLNSDIVPLLERYQALAEQYEQILDSQEVEEPSFLPSVRHVVCDLLTHVEQTALSNADTTVSLQSQLLSLSESHPAETLAGIREFLAVEDFTEAVEQLQSGCWHSDRNWKSIFATESASALHQDLLQGPAHHLPLFEVTCRLLYHTHPQELLDFVTFAQLARDHQAGEDSAFSRRCRKNFFYHRALDTLPIFVSPEATPTNPHAIQAHCRLLLQSLSSQTISHPPENDRPNVEMAALQLLLSNQMWSDAVSLLEEIRGQETATNHESVMQSSKSSQPDGAHCAMFQCLLTHLAKADVLHVYFERVWQLLPKRFSVFDFLGVLRVARAQHKDTPPILVPQGSPALTVSCITPKLLRLLEQVRTY